MSNSNNTHTPPARLGSTDLLVVGAGIVGTAHALAALDAGRSVILIDRDERPVGASVRNFGHACVTGQAGEIADLAQTARARWLEMSDRAGFFSVASGGLAVARNPEEMAVLEELHGQRGDQVGLLTRAQTAEFLGGGDRAIVGGARLADDVRVDPREAVPALVRYVADHDRATFIPRTSYLGHDGTTVWTSRGTITAQRTVLCVGHDLDYLAPGAADDHGIQRCALQMHLVDNPGRTILPAVLTGTSMLRYDAFAQTSAARELRARLETNRPDLLDIDANVMCTQRPDGTLLIGDSHRRSTTADAFTSEETSRLLLSEFAAVLGVPGFTVRQRWQGVYASSATAPYLVRELDQHVTAVAVTSGIGMTISFGLAARNLQSL